MLEKTADRPCYPSREAELARADTLIAHFREARTKSGAKSVLSFKQVRDDAVERLLSLQRKWHETKPVEVPPPAAPSSSAASAGTVTRLPKIDYPTFNGSLAKYRDWKDLFHKLLLRTPSLSDDEKKALLLKAMGTPETIDVATAAVHSSATYALTMCKMDDAYERSRLIFSQHLTELFQPDLIEYRRSHLERLQRRIQLQLRGLTRTDDFTAEQVVAVQLERYLAPSVLPHWRKHTRSIKVAPSVTHLLEFLQEHRDYAEDDSDLYAEADSPPTAGRGPTPTHPEAARTPLTSQPAPDKCVFCSAEHNLFVCAPF